MVNVNIASILLHLPNILLLDEIFIGQDLNNIFIILKILKELCDQMNQTIVICSHKPDIILNLANRVLILNKGKIVLDGPVNENLNKIFNFFYKFNKEKLKIVNESSFKIHFFTYFQFKRVFNKGNSTFIHHIHYNINQFFFQ